jgi:hypothetical protein
MDTVKITAGLRGGGRVRVSGCAFEDRQIDALRFALTGILPAHGGAG